MRLAWQITPLALAVTGALGLSAHGSIYGTMSNFDIYNETETEAHGAEIELEGIDNYDLSRTFPAHFDNKSVDLYNDASGSGVRIKYTGYNFGGRTSLAPTVGTSTNGHTCVNTPGCEHFGFSTIGASPTGAKFYWLDANGMRIGGAPQPIPFSGYNYIPAAGGGVPQLEVEVEPVEVHPQRADSVWLKLFKTKLDRAVDLDELMSNNGIVPEDAAETETEWELLEESKPKTFRDNLDDGNVKAIIRRFEYYAYTGPYDDEHEVDSAWNGEGEPPAGELGQFISANMEAANLEAPARTHGDFNNDGQVDAADFTLYRDNHGREDDDIADADEDGMIDEADVEVWRTYYGVPFAHNSLAASSAVPEPASVLLAMGAGLALVIAERKR
jgi:hypothetical protein